MATFDDGSSAVVTHRYGNGQVVAIGARLLDLVTRHWEGARFSPRRLYANTAAADADVWLLGLRSLYQEVVAGRPDAVDLARGDPCRPDPDHLGQLEHRRR